MAKTMTLSKIQDFRASVEKVVSMLTERGLEVTQSGVGAYVAYHRITGAPIKVNIPMIPDDADDAFVHALRGFIDHECAHVLFTDSPLMAAAMKGRPKPAFQTFNVIEDVRIERAIQGRFPGSAAHIRDTWEWIYATKMDKLIAGCKSEEEFYGNLLPTLVHAWSGKQPANDYLNSRKLWDRLAPLMARIAAIKPLVEVEIPDTQAALDIGELLYKALATPPEAPKKPKPPATSKKEKPPAASEEPCDDGEASDEPADAPSEEPPMEPEPEAERAEEPPPETDSEGDDAEPEEIEDTTGGEEGAPEEDEAAAPEEDEATAEGEITDEEEVESEDAGSTGDSIEDLEDETDDASGGGDDAPEDDEIEDEIADGEGDAPEDDDEDEDDSGTAILDPLNAGEMLGAVADFEGLLESAIEDALSKGTKAYLPYTLDYDEWVTPDPKPEHAASAAKLTAKIEKTTDAMVGQMASQFRRLFAQKEVSVMVGGLRSGRLHAPALHRLRVDDSRVFCRREEHNAQDTAVTLLVDCSGSMNGEKIQLALVAAYAFGQTLDRCGIRNEILGFTSVPEGAGDDDRATFREGLTKYKEVTGSYPSRYDMIRMLIFKGFDERFQKTRLRFGAMSDRANRPYHLCQNVDGESLIYAANRLAMQKEQRKVLIVFSDGSPSAGGDDRALAVHLKDTVKKLEKSRIETLGIGIQSEEVKRFYPKSVVISEATELPTLVMMELKKLLLGNVK